MSSRSGIKSYRVSFDFYVTPGIKFLLIANFAVFIVEALLYHFAGPFAYEELVKWFGLVPAGVIPLLHIWQPFTYLFLHDVNSIWHILVIMFMIWMFGRELEVAWGKSRFLRYYFLSGVGAGLINVIVKIAPAALGNGIPLTASTPSIGASGAIFGILVARSEEHTSELQSHSDLVCRLLLEKKKKKKKKRILIDKIWRQNTIRRAL